MLTITALTLLAQIQVSSAAVAQGRKLKGGTFRTEVAAQQATISPAEWEARKHVRYLGEVNYALRAESAAPATKDEKPARAQKPIKPSAPKSRRR